jgi:GNAT superfamily N-acetyltransferase
MTTGIPVGLRLRCATLADALEVHRLFGRCSPATRYGRFHGHLREVPPGYLCEALTAGPCRHDALVVQRCGGAELVALASARRVDGPGEPAVDVGVLVEDAEQGRGLGTLLLATLARRAGERGIAVLTCDVLATHQRLVAVLRRTLGPVATSRDGGTVHARVRLA